MEMSVLQRVIRPGEFKVSLYRERDACAVIVLLD